HQSCLACCAIAAPYADPIRLAWWPVGACGPGLLFRMGCLWRRGISGQRRPDRSRDALVGPGTPGAGRGLAARRMLSTHCVESAPTQLLSRRANFREGTVT